MIIELYLNISPSPDARELAELLRQLADRVEHTGIPGYRQLLTDDNECLGVIRSSQYCPLTEVRHG